MTANVVANDFKALWDDIGEDALAAVARVGESGWYVLGSEVEQFEADLARAHGVAHAVGCASGLDAIEICLRSAGIGAGDEVLTTPLTAFATALAILRAGATPRFADVDDRGLLDLEATERALAGSPAIKAVIPVHLYGHTVDIAGLKAIADRHGALIIEDAAQAITGRPNGSPAGSTTFAAATSFYPTKNLGALGDGGAVLTDDADVAATARRLRDYGQRAKYEHTVAGLNSRLDELQAAVLRTAVLPRLATALARRAEIAGRYLAGITNPRLHAWAPQDSSTWHLFPVFTASPAEREVLREHLAAAGVMTAVHYPILASAQQALDDPLPGDAFPVAQRLADTELSLPIHPYLRDAELQRVIDACNAW